MKKKMISILLCAALGITTLAAAEALREARRWQVNRQQPLRRRARRSAAPESTERRRARRALWQRKRRLTEAGKP